MVRIKAFSLSLALLTMLGAFAVQKIIAMTEADAQARRRASDQLQKDQAEADRIDRMRLESDFAGKIPPERRLKVEVASGLESAGIRLIVDLDIVRDPTPMPAGQQDGSEYPMDIQIEAPNGGYFAVHCNAVGCAFSPPGQRGDLIRGNLFAIPGDGCIYSTGEATGIGAQSVQNVHCLENGQFEQAGQ